MSETQAITGLQVPPFEDFGKIPRLSRQCIVTEKIDGTNAQIVVPEDPSLPLVAGSRNRYITPDADNYGFARWVAEHAEELRALGPGRHFGEWWGAGVQRGYGISEKRFSLFNTSRWHSAYNASLGVVGKEEPPRCCYVVPVLYNGEFSTESVGTALERLATLGSVAASGSMKPEGVMVYHVAAGTYFKKTIEKDAEPKSRAA